MRERERERERETERERERQTDRQTDRQTGRQTDRETDRQGDRERQMHGSGKLATSVQFLFLYTRRRCFTWSTWTTTARAAVSNRACVTTAAVLPASPPSSRTGTSPPGISRVELLR